MSTRVSRGSRADCLERAIGVKPVSSEIIGAIQRQVLDRPGILEQVVVDRLSRRFPRWETEGTIKMLTRKNGTLDRDESGGLRMRSGVGE